MARLTIAILQERLENEKRYKEDYYNKWKVLKDEKDREMNDYRIWKTVYDEQKEREINRLMSIIRILWKDPTLKSNEII